jgi:uncharacterized protein (TIGR03435 family)
MVFRRTCMLFTASLAAPFVSMAQTTPVPDWQKAAGGKMEFEVASVRQDTSGVFRPPSFSLSADDGSPPLEGLFHADFQLLIYIEFAYKIGPSMEQLDAMLAHLPKWVNSDRYQTEARYPGKPTKDQVRLMMQSLLAERFGLKVHFETQTISCWL